MMGDRDLPNENEPEIDVPQNAGDLKKLFEELDTDKNIKSALVSNESAEWYTYIYIMYDTCMCIVIMFVYMSAWTRGEGKGEDKNLQSRPLNFLLDDTFTIYVKY